MQRFHEQLSAHEGGMLTKYMVAPKVLGGIIETIAQSGYDVIPDLTWYYKYVEIEAVSISNSFLVFKFNLPTINKSNYLLYNIQSYPVPSGEESVSQNHCNCVLGGSDIGPMPWKGLPSNTFIAWYLRHVLPSSL